MRKKILIAGLIGGFIYTEYKKIQILFNTKEESENLKIFSKELFDIIREHRKQIEILKDKDYLQNKINDGLIEDVNKLNKNISFVNIKNKIPKKYRIKNK